MAGELAVLKPLNEDETKTLKNLTRMGETVTVVIPADIDAEKYKESLGTVCRAMGVAEAQESVLFPILGRMLQVAKDNGELLQALKADTFEKLVETIGKKFGVRRSTCFEAVKFCDRWGDNPINVFATVGRVKFRIISKAIPKGDEKSAGAKRLVEKAKELTIEELKDYCEQKGYLQRTETVGASFVIHTSKKRAKEFKAFFDTPEVHAVVGKEDWGSIMEAMIGECSSEWLARGAEMIKDAEGKQAKADQKKAAKEEQAESAT